MRAMVVQISREELSHTRSSKCKCMKARVDLAHGQEKGRKEDRVACSAVSQEEG